MKRHWVLPLILSGCTFGSEFNYLRQAEESSRRGEYAIAIEDYRRHMAARLAVTDRPEWENPYFYLVLIGDIQLGQDKVDEAIKSFLEAEANGVDEALISDRLRMVAHWYEKRHRLKEALDFLTRYRERDPSLFDPTLDRIAKRMTEEEDLSAGSPSK